MTRPTRERMFAALAPRTEQDRAEIAEATEIIRRQRAFGLSVPRIIRAGTRPVVAVLIGWLPALDADDPAAAEQLRDLCHRRLVQLNG